MPSVRTLFVLLALATPLAACGDDDGTLTSNHDGGPDADPGAPDAGPSATVFAVATDFATTGVATTIAVPSLDVTQDALAGVASTDPVVRVLDEVYVINRVAGNVTIVDRETLTLIDQLGLGGEANPQDVAVAGGKLYIVGLGLGAVQVFDPADLAAGAIDTIDLSSLDPDGVPDCHSIASVGANLYVSCGVLENFAPRGSGVVAVIDRAGGALDGMVELDHANPFGFLQPTADGDLLVATVPDFGDLTAGCVERVTTGPTPTAGCLVDNADLGGFASGLAPVAGAVWIATTGGFGESDPMQLRRFDLTDDALGAPASPDTQRVFDVAACPTGHLAVADAAGGARIYDADGAELTTELLDLGLPPVTGGLGCF